MPGWMPARREARVRVATDPAPSRRSRMPAAPIEFPLEIRPRARVDVIDVRGEVRSRYGDALDTYSRALCCSFHTTAGYLDQSVAARLNQNQAGVMPYID